eukprot:scaffold1.g5792.t1
MATLVCSNVTRPSLAFGSARSGQRQGRRLQRCYATAEDEKKTLSFESNRRAALGFTESDSAGQTNIFPVEPRSYVAGSSDDSTSGLPTFVVGVVGGLVAAAAISAGLLANSSGTGLDRVAPSGEYKALSAYAAEFAGELAPAPAAAPGPAE